MITILCWLWRQPACRTTYTAHHVNVWRDMLERNLTIDHEFACVTDMPAGIDPCIRIIPPPRDFENITLPKWTSKRPQCLRRMALFRPDAADVFGAERIVSTDLDIVVVGPVDDLFTGTDDVRLLRGTIGSRPYNGSLMMLTAGARTKVYTELTQAKAIQASNRYIGSDQAWLAFILGLREKTWGPEHGVVAWQQRNLAKGPLRLVTYPGGSKPDRMAETGDTFALKHYRRSPSGRCLVLGYGARLWDDVAAALPDGFDGVIASPEAALHWPTQPLAIADDDAHAERLAAIHGFAEVVFCGRSSVGVT